MKKKTTATKKKTTPTKKKPPATTGNNSAAIRIRMYRVGFGDCFLVSFPLQGDYKHVLVDCGVHSRGDIGTMDRVIADIEKVTGGKLALVVATHAHQDHISGFGRGKDIFKTFSEVGQVWMPWTENPDDDQANKLKRKRMSLAMQLEQHFQLAANASSQAVAAVMNIVGNQPALDFLHSGFNGKAKVLYLQAGDKIQSAPIPGLTVKVLGPPRDQEFLAKMDPPAGQRYLRLAENGQSVEANVLKPFGDRWVVSRKDKSLDNLRLDENSEGEMNRQLTDPALEELAFTVDQALNNTSVVLLLTFAGQNLLFPGDAQYGNWKAWLDQEWADDLLGNVHFYKVSHHGSFNATPKDAVQKMKSFAAMASTQNVPWASIPRLPLMKALAEQSRNRVVRSDSLAIQDANKAPKGPVMSSLPENFTKGDFWYDYMIPV
jgi:beta-lactamase superfamily II metal-dependent hydrolase